MEWQYGIFVNDMWVEICIGNTTYIKDSRRANYKLRFCLLSAVYWPVKNIQIQLTRNGVSHAMSEYGPVIS